MENIGYAKTETECRYNIGIMEERQSIIGLGAGASSKRVSCQARDQASRDWSLEG